MLDHDSEGCVKKKKNPPSGQGKQEGGPLHKKAVAYTFRSRMPKTAQSVQRNACKSPH